MLQLNNLALENGDMLAQLARRTSLTLAHRTRCGELLGWLEASGAPTTVLITFRRKRASGQMVYAR